MFASGLMVLSSMVLGAVVVVVLIGRACQRFVWNQGPERDQQAR